VPTPGSIQRTYLVLLLGNTLAASLIWGINTIFLLDAGLSNLEAFAANAFFTAGMVVFEVPTGVVADTAGRRVSYLLGTVTLAASTLLYVLLWRIRAPFWQWAVVSILIGLGFTFFSGAVEAWLVDALKATGFTGGLEAVFGRGQVVTGAATLGGSVAAPIVVASEVPPWIGALDVLILAGDDSGDPALVSAAATGVRRGARVVVVAPYEGPLRDATAGRSVSLAPRVWVRDDFRLARYLAAGLAVLQVVDPGLQVDLAALADELDAEAFRNSAGRELFTNPAKTLAERMSGRDVVLAGDNAATLALARHAAAILLRIAHQAVAAVGLADALVAVHDGMGAHGAGLAGADHEMAIFHDEQIDGPLPRRVRTFVLATDAERPVVVARVSGLDGVDVINSEDVPQVSDVPQAAVAPATGRPEQQLAMLAVRLEMTATYLRLVRG